MVGDPLSSIAVETKERTLPPLGWRARDPCVAFGARVGHRCWASVRCPTRSLVGGRLADADEEVIRVLTEGEGYCRLSLPPVGLLPLRALRLAYPLGCWFDGRGRRNNNVGDGGSVLVGIGGCRRGSEGTDGCKGERADRCEGSAASGVREDGE